MNIEKFDWESFDALYDEVSEMYKSKLSFEDSDGKLVQLLSMAANISTENEFFADEEHRKRINVVRQIEGSVGAILEELFVPTHTTVGF